MSNDEFYLKNTFEEFEGKWVAIQDQKVVASDKDFEILTKKLKEKNIKLNQVSFASIPGKNISLSYSSC